MAITDATGSVAARYRYDPYGRVTHVGGSDPALAARNPLRYRAYYLDAATGLYYLLARYYDPGSARFLSADPAPPDAGEPATLNRSCYTPGDPVNHEDPDGRRWIIGRERSAIDTVTYSRHLEARRSPTPANIAANRAAQVAVRPGVSAADVSRAASAAHRARAASAAAGRARAAAAARESALAQRAIQGDGTPYGRWNTHNPSRPDAVAWGVSATSVTLDVMSIPSPMMVVTIPVGIGIDLIATGYYIVQWGRGHATAGDVVVSAFSAVPYLGSAVFVAYTGDAIARILGHDGIPWAVPQTIGGPS